MQRPPVLSHQSHHALLRSRRLQHSVLRLLLVKGIFNEQPSRIRKLADCRVLAAATGSGMLSSCTCFTSSKHHKIYRGRCFSAMLRLHTCPQQTWLQNINIRRAAGLISANIRAFKMIREYQNMWCMVHLQPVLYIDHEERA